jgi:hypothetical protein
MKNETLLTLIHAQLEGEISPEQHAQLEALLRGDWQARRLYLELADQHARLLHQPEIVTGRLHEKVTPPRLRPRFMPWLASLAAAAVLVLGFVLWQQPPTQTKEEATSAGIATLSNTLNAEFSGATVRSGDTLRPGLLRLTKGLAQIEFFSGATVLIEGAAEIDILSAWEARCVRGRMRVQVPPAAKGFTIHAPEVKLEDLGTEFALNVKDGTSAVHVFEGEVIAHQANQSPASLKQGISFRSKHGAALSPQDFLPIRDLAAQRRQMQTARFTAWQKWAETQRTDNRLIARYIFQHHADDRWDRLVMNAIEPRVPTRAGGAVGARWTEGRWPGKDALEFKRPGDRMRMNLDGTYTALTFSCWVKLDAVDKKYNALLLTDGYDSGEPHWQIHEDGSLMFSIAYASGTAGAVVTKDNQIYYSCPVFTADTLGRWHHIAVSYDATSGEVVQYFDGREVSREIHAKHQPGRPITFGRCEIGNWGLPTSSKNFPIRNLNGAMDEFAIYSVALNSTELRTIFENGKPE